MDYRNKVILAPMVRIGALPFRLLALDYGADIVYTEEIIDFKLLRCRRVVNDALGTVDFMDDDFNVVFRTCDKEKSKVVVQIGTCCPERAVAAAKLIETDVAGIDVNMGCPKSFSLKGGMGAALLTQPDKVKAILSSLVKEVNLPISCKIRVLSTIEETVKLAKLIESTGVAALGIHGRTRSERPQHTNRNHFIGEVAKAITIPVIANGGSGEIKTYDDIEKFRQETGAASVMIARTAESNCSIFRPDGLLDLEIVIKSYLKYAIEYDNHVSNTKYTIQNILGSLQESPRGKTLLSASQLREICDIFGMTEYYQNFNTKLRAKCVKFNNGNEFETTKNSIVPDTNCKKLKSEIKEMPLQFLRNFFQEPNLPKSMIVNYVKKFGFRFPKYRVVQVEKLFIGEVSVDGQVYRSSFLAKNKKFAEQSAALVAAAFLGLVDNDIVSQCSSKGLVHERICDKNKL